MKDTIQRLNNSLNKLSITQIIEIMDNLNDDCVWNTSYASELNDLDLDDSPLNPITGDGDKALNDVHNLANDYGKPVLQESGPENEGIENMFGFHSDDSNGFVSPNGIHSAGDPLSEASTSFENPLSPRTENDTEFEGSHSTKKFVLAEEPLLGDIEDPIFERTDDSENQQIEDIQQNVELMSVDVESTSSDCSEGKQLEEPEDLTAKRKNKTKPRNPTGNPRGRPKSNKTLEEKITQIRTTNKKSAKKLRQRKKADNEKLEKQIPLLEAQNRYLKQRILSLQNQINGITEELGSVNPNPNLSP